MDLPFHDHIEAPLIPGYADSTVTHSPVCFDSARLLLDRFEQSREPADFDALLCVVKRLQMLAVVVSVDAMLETLDD
jgi:hypothetical protein